MANLMAERILYCTILQHYSLVKHILTCKWSNAYFKRSWGWPSAVTDISICLGYACVMHCKESGVIVFLPLGVTKIFSFPWMMTEYNSSGIDRKCCYCKICKIWFPAETNTARLSKAWPERLFPVIQQNLSLLSTVLWAQQLYKPRL